MVSLRALVVLSMTLTIGRVFATETFDLAKIEILAWKELSYFNLSSAVEYSAHDLALLPDQRVLELFKDVPGVIISQNGGPGGRSSLFLRGTESRHVTYTLDGLKLNDVSNVDRQFDAAFFSAPLIKKMIIYKGPQAVMLGSDAMGGAVEMQTHKGEKAPLTRLELGGGSFGTATASLRSDWVTATENSRGSLTFYRMQTDGISRLNKKRFNAKEADGAETVHLTSSSHHILSKKVQTDVLISFVRGENELDGTSSDNPSDRSINDQYILQQKTNFQLNQGQALSLRNGLNRHHRFLKTLSSGQDSLGGENIEHEFIMRKKRSLIDTMLGISTSHENFNMGQTDKEFDVHSIFIQSALSLDQWRLQGGLRSERHVQYGHFHTGSFGFLYQQKQSEFSFQASQGFKAPSLYQLYAPTMSGAPIGNPNLLPEKNVSLEIRLNQRFNNFLGEISLYQNKLSDLITYSLGQGYLNQSAFSTQGAELNGRGMFKDIKYSLSYIFQDFIENESPVLRRPLQSWLGKVAYLFSDKFEFETRLRWHSHRYDLNDSGEVVKLNSYEVVDLGLKYFFRQVSLGFHINNLFERDYEDLYGFSVMPRSYLIQLSLDF